MKNSFLRNSLICFSACLVLLSSASFLSNIILSVQAGATVYDLIEHASEAQWSSGAGVLPFPGDPSDSRGFARYVNNVLLEDGDTWSRVLETHPQWVGNGYIMGRYPQQTVSNNVQLTARVGFLSGATGTDGVIFEIRFLDLQQNTYTVLSHVAAYDGRLDSIVKDLGYLAGKTGYFILYVGAGQTSNRDWAVWAEARIETKPLPDLAITDVWETGGLIHYRVKNIGDAATTSPGMPADSFQNCLSIDGKQVAKHVITRALKPGEEVEGVFDHAWQPAPGEHVIRACADCEQNIDESNEGNNCLEEKWFKQNLPDLIITEIRCDRDNSLIGYVVKNIGSEVAKENHSTTLHVNGKEFTHDLVGVDLKPGEIFESWFKDYEWPECRNITVKVCADNFNQVKESDEENNCLERNCTSYPVPILIASGPSAVNVTRDSVIIKWVTNKNSDNMVVYSDRSTGEEKTVYDPGLVKDHWLRITGLKPRTTYRFYVKSKDPCGNLALSKIMVFETMPPPDEEKPSVTLFLPERLVGIVNILANASDNVNVEGVIFSIDKVVKFIDFSPPYVWVCNTTLHPNGVHSFDATALDAAGNRAIDVKNGTIANPLPDTNPPDVQIVNPRDRGTVHGLVRIEALIQDMEYHAIPAGHIQKAEIYIDGALVRRWEYSSFRYDFFRREVVPEPPTSSLSFTHLWNTTRLEPGSEHVIEVKAWDDSGNYGRDSIKVSILRFEWAPPPLEYRIIDINVTRNVVRHDDYRTTYFVTLFVRNMGTETLYNLTLRDDVCGFQVIPHTAFMSVEFVPSFWTSTVIFKPPGEAALSPGGVATIQYYAVPILFAPTIPDDCYIFGWLDTSISFSCDGTNYGRSFQLKYHPGDLSSILRSADYIIITHPSRLFSHNPDDEDGVNSLLVQMAELARLKSGILGYLRGGLTADEIKAFISPSGAWASRLSPVFRDPNPERDNDAYVLIVGETEIVPSYTVTSHLAIPVWTGSIKLCDNIYSDVVGEDVFPDLILGRIIGENARNLMIPIQTSIDVALGHGFDRGFALGVSGYEDGGYAVHAVDIAEDVVRDLAGQGVLGETLHWSNFIRHSWSFRFTNYDAFALGDVDGDSIDEVIIASDEYDRIYVYEPMDRSLVRDFPCTFTHYDGLAASDGMIVVASNEEEHEWGTIDVYSSRTGESIASGAARFENWDALALGDFFDSAFSEEEGREIGCSGDEIVTISLDDDEIRFYTDLYSRVTLIRSRTIDIDFSRFDGFAVGNFMGEGNEIAIIRDDDECIYIYDADGRRRARIEYVGEGDTRRHVRYTRYDGFAAGDVDGDGRDEIIVVCDDDKEIYVYYWDGAKWMWSGYYSRFLGDWFYGIRYTGSPTRHDCLAIGRVIPDESPSIVIIRNRDGDLSSFEVLVPRKYWADPGSVDEWANKRVSYLGYSDYPGKAVSFITIYGHGNPYGASPLGVPYESKWGYFSQHPFVFSMGCNTGDYDSWGDSFGEAFFRHGAGVFVGATENTVCCISETVTKEFYELWDVWHIGAGKAYTLYERRMCRPHLLYPGHTGTDPLWALCFNYYGDPKFPAR
ncbi:MAG: CARDB domain-containing protein [Thermoproteota archaeon]